MAGFEPTTSRLLSGCSTAKLHWLQKLHRTITCRPLQKVSTETIKFLITARDSGSVKRFLRFTKSYKTHIVTHFAES